jgi:hypothetical protein
MNLRALKPAASSKLRLTPHYSFSFHKNGVIPRSVTPARASLPASLHIECVISNVFASAWHKCSRPKRKRMDGMGQIERCFLVIFVD